MAKNTPGCKFAPRMQICTRMQIVHMNPALGKEGLYSITNGIMLLLRPFLPTGELYLVIMKRFYQQHDQQNFQFKSGYDWSNGFEECV